MNFFRRRGAALLFFLWLVAIAGAGWLVWREKRPAPPGLYARIAQRLNEKPGEFCDQQVAATRLLLGQVIDQVRPGLLRLWAGRSPREFPDHKMEQVGPVFLRLSSKAKAEQGYEISHWSWEEARGIFTRTQTDPADPDTKERWRDLDTSARFLFVRDTGRLFKGNKYLPPQKTAHQFRPSPTVTRKKEVYFLRLDPGDFAGAEKKLALIFERAWSSSGPRVKVLWVKNDPHVYRMRANFSSSQSYVNHKNREMVIANFAWTQTVAHELGHILGFADHYYSVWNSRNCYYTQESRVGDLMSNSERGRVTAEHWRILDRAYPSGSVAPVEPFSYFFR